MKVGYIDSVKKEKVNEIFFTGSLYFCANTNGITSTPFLAHNHIAGSIVLGIESRQASQAVTC
jgi:hypothetical protein